MSDAVYCYPGSDVLINKLNIRNLDRLYEVEKKLTMLRISDLLDEPIKGMFDLTHLQSIHKYIFQVCDYGKMYELFSKCLNKI